MLEGRCQAFSIDIEKRMKEQYELFKQESESKHLQHKEDYYENQKLIAKSNQKLEDYKNEVNKMFKDEEKSMKEWTNGELNREVKTLNLAIYERVEESKTVLKKEFNEKIETETRQRNERGVLKCQ
jgi:hypothetical protein